MKEFHLWLDIPLTVPQNLIDKFSYTYESTLRCIDAGFDNINTTQIILCTTDLFEKGYRIFVHDSNYKTYEIKLGVNEQTGREIRMGHCLYKLILSGEFDKH